MRIGICGFPGSGKTTVFRALSPGGSQSKGGIAFGNIKVPDESVDALAGIFQPKKTTYGEITFLDVGGRGGKAGAAFHPAVLQAMRNADALVHVVRAFPSPLHESPPDPRREKQAFDDELVLLDLGILEKRGERLRKENRKIFEISLNDRCVAHLESGEPLRTLELSRDDRASLGGIQLLSLLPRITLYNIAEEAIGGDLPPAGETDSLALCASIEAEIAEMDEADQPEFLADLGLAEPGRIAFIQTAFRSLDLVRFLTVGPDECRAWPIPRGTQARKAAGEIHSDLERGFIRAEVYRVEDLLEHGTEAALKAKGLIRQEGKEYVVADGDVMHVRFNV